MKTKDHPAPISPSQLLLEKLHILHQRLSNTEKDQQTKLNTIQAYNYFINHSPLGRDCTYAKKCIDIFYSQMYEDVKQMILELVDLVRQVDEERE
jgi:hypothetical protein